MLSQHTHPYQLAIGSAALALSLPLAWLASATGDRIAFAPPLFATLHTAVEIASVVLAMLIFITGYRAILSPRKGAVVWLGVSYFGVGLLDFLHLLRHVGMVEDPLPHDVAGSTLLWLAARMLSASALLVYALLPTVPDVDVRRKRMALALMLLLVAMLGYASHWGTASLVDVGWLYAHGFTLLLGLTTLAVFWVRRLALANECLMALSLAAGFAAVSAALLLLSGSSEQTTLNVLGHVYLLASHAYLFHATFNEAMRRPLEKLEMQHLREKVTLNAAPDAILWVDHHGQILMANPSTEVLTGYAPAELVGKNVDIFLPERMRDQHADSMRHYFLNPHARAMGLTDLKLMRRDGRMLPVDIALGYWEDDGKPHAIAYIRDLTERKKFEESLRHHATHDELTDLPNRWLFQLQLNQALARATRTDLRVAVLLLDLDHFKSINDSFGHAAGDALLIQVGQRIHACLRASDTLARMGGDEFAILLTDLVDADEAVGVATKLLGALQAPYHLPQHDVYTGASVGLAFFPDDARDSDTLLRYADMAMYQAKQAGRGSYACYSHELDQRVHADMQLHNRLKEAIAKGGLSMYYQPQVDIRRGEVVGVEALLRWHDPVLGSVSPAQFIPIAETTGLILALSDWVLDTVCQQVAAWCRAGTPLRVAVNISAHQLHQGHLTDKVKAALLRTGAQARWLDLEITETVAMTQPKQALQQLNALVDMGCRVSLDDFGTGYSSLAYLKALPVSKIKIDQSFVRDITSDPSDAAIVQTIIGMADTLELDVIAEGVETEAQRALLQNYGCPAYQGYLYSPPLPLLELEALLHPLSPKRPR